jgi:hypothetical protein
MLQAGATGTEEEEEEEIIKVIKMQYLAYLLQFLKHFIGINFPHANGDNFNSKPCVQ